MALSKLATLVGRYESMVLKTSTRHYFEETCRGLESLMARWPKKKQPQQFDRADIESWHKGLLQGGKGRHSAAKWRSCVRSFFTWCQQQEEFVGENPATERQFVYH